MTWWATGAGIPNFEPFDGVNAIVFWIKNKDEPGVPVPVRLILFGDATKPNNSPTPLPWEPEPTYCDSEVFLSVRTPDETAGNYKKYIVNMCEFNCTPEKIKKLNKIDFLALSDTEFCVDELQLV